METKRHILLIFVALLLGGCGSGDDPMADARHALAAGDRRLIGYMGIGLVVPGTPAGFEHWNYAPGVRVRSNVTDTSPGDEIDNAADYATKYNQVILGGTP